MQANKLKHFRQIKGETQKDIAEALGVSQPTYQRWEKGRADIQPEYLSRLAIHFDVAENELLGKRVIKEVAYLDAEAASEVAYYGECAIHFVGGGKPLLVSISMAAYERVFNEMQSDGPVLVFQDLGNRTIVVRRAAISELYLSSDDYDFVGEEHYEYETATPLLIPDEHQWTIIEAMVHSGELDDELKAFSDEEIQEVGKKIGLELSDLNTLIHIKHNANYDENSCARIIEHLDRFRHLLGVNYQLSTGAMRHIEHLENYDYPFEMLEASIAEDETNIILLDVADHHRTHFINSAIMDYISFPTHKLGSRN